MHKVFSLSIMAFAYIMFGFITMMVAIATKSWFLGAITGICYILAVVCAIKADKHLKIRSDKP